MLYQYNKERLRLTFCSRYSRHAHYQHDHHAYSKRSVDLATSSTAYRERCRASKSVVVSQKDAATFANFDNSNKNKKKLNLFVFSVCFFVFFSLTVVLQIRIEPSQLPLNTLKTCLWWLSIAFAFTNEETYFIAI